MKTLTSALIAVAVLGAAAATAHAEKKPYVGTHDWWAQQDSNRN